MHWWRIGLYIAIVVASFYLSFIVHECGHLLAGLSTHFTLQRFVIPPLLISRVRRRSLKVRWKWDPIPIPGVECGTRDSRNLRKRCLVLALGGPVASFLLTVSAFCIVIAFNNLGSFLEFFLKSIAVVSLESAVLVSIPFKFGLQNSDAQTIRMPLAGGPEAERFCSLITLQSQLSAGMRPRQWDEALLRLATKLADDSEDSARGALLAYRWALLTFA